MYGSLYFYKECQKVGIKPIIGLFADVLDDDEESAHPLILLAKNLQGYHNLLKISSAIQTKSTNGLPRNWLRAYSKGLIAISPGAVGKIEKYLAMEKFEEATREATKLLEVFGPRTVLSIDSTTPCFRRRENKSCGHTISQTNRSKGGSYKSSLLFEG